MLNQPLGIRIGHDGKTYVVTGAAAGIGLAISRALLGCGATVIAVDTDASTLKREFTDAERVHPVAATVGTDTTADLAAAIRAVAPSVDGIVNNVGVDANRSLHELDEADAERTLRTNLLGPWFLTRELMNPLVRAGRPGAVVFLTSLHQWFTRGHPDYSTSKAAIGMLVREMAREMAPTVRVNAVAPGAVNLHDEASKEFAFEEDRARPLLPLGRLGRPHDIAGQVAVLLDNALSGYITGTTIVVDGGLSLHTWLDDLYTSAADERTQNRLV